MLRRLEEAGFLQIRIFQQVRQGVGRSVRDIGRSQQRRPFRRGFRFQPVPQRPVHRIGVLPARIDRAEARVLHPFRLAHRGEDLGELHVRHRDHAQIAVLGFERPAMRRQHARVTQTFFRFVQRAVPQMLDEHEVQHRFHHRHMHFLALAGALPMEQRHADHRGQHVSGQLVGCHGGEIARRPIRPGVQRRHAAEALDQIVIGRIFLRRAALAKAGGTGMDDARVAGGHGGIAKPEPVRGTDAHVVHEHIRTLDQPPQRVHRRLALQVQHDAALVAVQIGEIRPHATGAAGPDLARGVAAGDFDLDDIGAEIAQPLGAERPQHNGRQVDYPDPGQRATSRRSTGIGSTIRVAGGHCGPPTAVSERPGYQDRRPCNRSRTALVPRNRCCGNTASGTRCSHRR